MGLTFNNGRNAAAITSTSSLNVGIGTSTPYDFGLSTMRTLQVEGSSYGTVIAKSGAVGSFLISDSTVGGNGGAVGTYTNHDFKFTTNNVERMRITTSGKVGIGTTTPSNTYQGLTLYGTDPSLSLQTSSAGGWCWTQYVNSSGTTNFSMGVNQSLPFWGVKVGAGMDNPALAVISSGNVGINLTNPTGQLSIANQISNGANPVTSYSATSGVNGQNFFNGYYAVNSDGSGTYPRYFDIVSVGSPDGTNGGSNIRLFTNPIATSSPAVERMRISSSGRVGIGTTNPRGAGGLYNGMEVYGVNGASILLTNGSGEVTFLYTAASGGDFLLENSGSQIFRAGSAERMRITSGGFVYVGASSMPNGQKFGVVGSGVWDGAAIGLQNTGSGGQSYTMFSTNSAFSQGAGNFLLYNPSGAGDNLIVYANGNYKFAGSNVSDRRLKQDIEDLNFGLSEIMKLSPKSYNLKSENNLSGENIITLKKNYGFIAQEMQEVLPEIVTGKETETEYLGLDYNSVLAVAVKAIQELEARIKTLENK